MTIEAILRSIVTERQCQDSKYGGQRCDDMHTPGCWAQILMRHLGLAFSDAAEIDPVRYRKQLIRVAATCVAAVESLDRLTKRELVAGEHQVGSGH